MGMIVKLLDNSQQVLYALQGAQYKALDTVGYAAESNVKLLVPVDTGRLKGSIGHYVDDKSVIIGTNVEYGEYVETNDNARHPNGGQAHFLRDGITKHQSEYKEMFKQALTR